VLERDRARLGVIGADERRMRLEHERPGLRERATFGEQLAADPAADPGSGRIGAGRAVGAWRNFFPGACAGSGRERLRAGAGSRGGRPSRRDRLHPCPARGQHPGQDQHGRGDRQHGGQRPGRSRRA
jgi:hypothetical protein